MISVCIATYNGEKYVKEQIESILPQLCNSDEIIISDDGSSDNTIPIIQSLESSIIKIIYNKGEHGYTPNFENALKNAKGDYIFLSDQDDVWTNEKVRRMSEYLLHYDMVISDADVIDSKGNLLTDSYFKERKSKGGFINNLLRFSYLGCSMAFRKKILEKAIPFPSNHSYCTHDNWLGIVGMAFYKTIIIEEKLFHYRRHNSNTSNGGLQDSTSLWFKIRYRVYLIWWLLRLAKKNT